MVTAMGRQLGVPTDSTYNRTLHNVLGGVDCAVVFTHRRETGTPGGAIGTV